MFNLSAEINLYGVCDGVNWFDLSLFRLPFFKVEETEKLFEIIELSATVWLQFFTWKKKRIICVAASHKDENL